MSNTCKEQMRKVIELKRAQMAVKLINARIALNTVAHEERMLENDIRAEKEIFHINNNEKLTPAGKAAEIEEINKYRYEEPLDDNESNLRRKYIAEERLADLLDDFELDETLSLTEMFAEISEPDNNKEEGYAATNQQREEAKAKKSEAKAKRFEAMRKLIEAQNGFDIADAEALHKSTVSELYKTAKGTRKGKSDFKVSLMVANDILQQRLEATKDKYNTSMLELEKTKI